MRKVLIMTLTLVLSLTLALPALAGPPNHKAVFVLNEASYTVDGVTKSMDAKTFATKNRTYVPVRYLAYACGVSEKDIGYANGQVTLALGSTTVKLWVNKRDLRIGNEAVTMDVSVLAQGGRTYLPARWVAEAFGYRVDWVPAQQAVLVYPPQGEAPAIPVEIPQEPVAEFEPEGNLKNRYPNDPYVSTGYLSRADFMTADLNDLPIKVGSVTVYRVWRDPNDQEGPWAGEYHILAEQSQPNGGAAKLIFFKDKKIITFADNRNTTGLTHWTQSYSAHLDTLLTADEIGIAGGDSDGTHILIIPNPAKGGQ